MCLVNILIFILNVTFNLSGLLGISVSNYNFVEETSYSSYI